MILKSGNSLNQSIGKYNNQQQNQMNFKSRNSQKKVLQKLYPANQIIGKNYLPDEPLKLKLAQTLEKKRMIQSKQKFQLRNTYQKKKIQEWDTLLNYVSKQTHKLIYIKFENIRHMALQFNNRTINYFSGFFTSTQFLSKKESKQQKMNIYQEFNDIKFKGYSYPISSSFFQNSIKNQDGISFSSNFQSGNLFSVLQKQAFQYELFLQNDINSKGNTQWFYFAVKFTQKATYKFNIINLIKTDSLYKIGMKISSYSFRQHQLTKKGWHRAGNQIFYSPSNLLREGTNFSYYTLHFQYTCQYDNDIVIFSNCYPYTYTQLENYFSRKLNKKRQSKITKVPICKSVSGLNIYSIKFGDPNIYQFNKSKSYIKKKSLIFMARQHSGQTPSSFVIQGILDTLIQSKQVELLKKQFVIYVIPMINPDGVYYGNYRTNLSGQDMNRKWRNPSKTLQPEIYYVKRFLFEINKINPIILIIDCHGHSKKTNSFFYGNPSNQQIFSQNSKIYPLLCSKRNKRISYLQSTFSITQDKTRTARVVLHQMFPHALVYTFQASFYGFKKQKNNNTIIQQFSIQSYKKIGKDILLGYWDYINILSRNNFQIKEQILKQISSLSKNIVFDDSGSDSEAQIDSFPQFQKQINYPTYQQINYRRIQKNSKTEKVQIIQTTQQCTQTQAIINNQNHQLQQDKDKSIKIPQNSLSILRILPLTPLNSQQKHKKSLHKSKTHQLLKTIRKYPKQYRESPIKIMKNTQEQEKNQKFLYIKNIKYP